MLSVISRLLPIALLVVQSGILILSVKRKLLAKFPLFFSYILLYSVSLGTVMTVLLFKCCDQYAYVYWTLSLLNVALLFGVMYELFTNALKPYSALIDLGKMLFRWAAVFMLLAAAITALATNGPNITKLLNSMAVLDRSLRLMQCGLLLLVLFFDRRLGLSWRSHGMAIAIGMGIFGSVDLIVSYAEIHVGFAARQNLDILNGLCYLGVVIFWAVCLSLPEPEKRNVLNSPTRLIFQRWNEVLMSTPLVNASNQASLPVESFLPGVERAVERVMARKMAN